MTERECQKIIFDLAIKHGVSPNLIKTRLLSDLDKNDMLQGLLTIESLEANLEVWKEYGMPDCVSDNITTKLNIF